MIQVLGQEGDSGWSVDPVREDVLRNGPERFVELRNLHYVYCKARASNRAGLLLEFVSAVLLPEEIPESWELAQNKVYVLVRARERKQPNFRGCSLEPISQITWPFVDDLGLVFICDLGETWVHIDTDIMEDWGQSFDTMLPTALANLRKLKPPRWVELSSGVFRLQSDVSFRESYLLVDQVMDQLPSESPMVCMPVNHGILLAASSASVASLVALLQEAKRCLQEEPCPMSTTMLVRRAGRWEPFQVMPEIAHQAEDVKRVMQEIVYSSQQTELLEREKSQ
jgi:hypothetical protein